MSSSMKGFGSYPNRIFLPLCSYHSLPYATKSQGKEPFFFCPSKVLLYLGCLIDRSLTVHLRADQHEGHELGRHKVVYSSAASGVEEAGKV